MRIKCVSTVCFLNGKCWDRIPLTTKGKEAYSVVQVGWTFFFKFLHRWITYTEQFLCVHIHLHIHLVQNNASICICSYTIICKLHILGLTFIVISTSLILLQWQLYKNHKILQGRYCMFIKCYFNNSCVSTFVISITQWGFLWSRLWYWWFPPVSYDCCWHLLCCNSLLSHPSQWTVCTIIWCVIWYCIRGDQLRIEVFWDVTLPSSSPEELFLDCSSETWGDILPAAQCIVPADMNFQQCHSEFLKSLKYLFVVKSQGNKQNVLALSWIIYWPLWNNSLQIKRHALSCIVSDKQMRTKIF